MGPRLEDRDDPTPRHWGGAGRANGWADLEREVEQRDGPVHDEAGVTAATRRLSHTFRGTKAEATGELRRFVTECGAGLQGRSTVTLAVALNTFMDTATLSATTRQDWSSLIDRHLIPELGATPVWKLTARDCDHLYQRLRVAGLDPSRVQNAHVVLHRAIALAVRWGWIARNPVSDATRPEVPRSTVTPPNLAEVRCLLHEIRGRLPSVSSQRDDYATRTAAATTQWPDVDPVLAG